MRKPADTDTPPSAPPAAERHSPLLESLLTQTEKTPPPRNAETYPYTLVGAIDAFDESGYPVVSFTLDDRHYRHSAKATLTLRAEHVGAACVMTFHQGRLDQPIITGLLQPPQPVAATVHSERPVTIRSDSGITLQCGAARIELTADGTINIQGLHINNQAYGPNRIKGGSVKIN